MESAPLWPILHGSYLLSLSVCACMVILQLASVSVWPASSHSARGLSSPMSDDHTCKQPRKAQQPHCHLQTTMKRQQHQENSFFMVTPICAGDREMVTLAASKAVILSVAVPLPPEMMAPAWPIRLPGGAVNPAPTCKAEVQQLACLHRPWHHPDIQRCLE